MKHKHADLIKAWADGAEVEYLSFTKEWIALQNPSWREDSEYRIKPEPKPDVSFYGYLSHLDGITYCDVVRCLSLEWHPRDNLKLTFDGESGKLKRAEVLE